MNEYDNSTSCHNDQISKTERFSKLSERLTTIQNAPSEVSLLKHKIQRIEITLQETKEDLYNIIESLKEENKNLNQKLQQFIGLYEEDKKIKSKVETIDKRLSIIEGVIPDLDEIFKEHIKSKAEIKPDIDLDFINASINEHFTFLKKDFSDNFNNLKEIIYDDINRLNIRIGEVNEEKTDILQNFISKINSEFRTLYTAINKESQTRDDALNSIINSFDEFIKRVQSEIDNVRSEQGGFEEDVFKLFGELYERLINN